MVYVLPLKYVRILNGWAIETVFSNRLWFIWANFVDIKIYVFIISEDRDVLFRCSNNNNRPFSELRAIYLLGNIYAVLSSVKFYVTPVLIIPLIMKRIL